MDKDNFSEYMNQTKKSLATISAYINPVRLFKDFLQKHKKVNNLNEARPSIDMAKFLLNETE